MISIVSNALDADELKVVIESLARVNVSTEEMKTFIDKAMDAIDSGWSITVPCKTCNMRITSYLQEGDYAVFQISLH